MTEPDRRPADNPAAPSSIESGDTMPELATSLPADAQLHAVGLADAHARPAGFDAVYDVDIEGLRGCRRPLAQYAAGTGLPDEDRRAAGRSGAR
jgi:hypothetical protein